MDVKRRTQPERSAATREALIRVARELFATEGYAGVGTERIVAAAGVTRGALYHQFKDKADLFAAVLEQVEVEVITAIGERLRGQEQGDILAVLVEGADAWLAACADPAVARIVLVDGPAVLGWAEWRAVGLRYGLGLVGELLRQGIASGQLPDQPVLPTAHVLVGSLDEAALYIAQADDPEQARAEMRAVTRRLVQAVAAGDS